MKKKSYLAKWILSISMASITLSSLPFPPLSFPLSPSLLPHSPFPFLLFQGGGRRRGGGPGHPVREGNKKWNLSLNQIKCLFHVTSVFTYSSCFSELSLILESLGQTVQMVPGLTININSTWKKTNIISLIMVWLLALAYHYHYNHHCPYHYHHYYHDFR